MKHTTWHCQVRVKRSSGEGCSMCTSLDARKARCTAVSPCLRVKDSARKAQDADDADDDTPPKLSFAQGPYSEIASSKALLRLEEGSSPSLLKRAQANVT